MVNRWIGIITLALMLIANAAVLLRDVVPNWMANDPPPSVVTTLTTSGVIRTQVGIFDDEDRELGRSWTVSKKTGIGGIVTVETNTLLQPLSLPRSFRTPRVRIQTKLTFRTGEQAEIESTRDANAVSTDHLPPGDIVVDDLDFRMHGLGIPISLKAEAMPQGDFPFEWQVGHRTGRGVLNSRAPAALGDVIRPFDRLPKLYEGRRWKIDLLDPLAQIMPGMDTSGFAMDPVIVEVTGREVIEYRGVSVKAFVVEGGGAKAWVDSGGRVLRQEVVVPVLGKLVLLDEPYDEKALDEAMRAVPSESVGVRGEQP